MNALLYTDPFAKICLLCSLAKYANKRIVYIDLDTVFSAYARNRICSFDSNLKIFLPRENEFENILTDICSDMKEGELVVLDSLNSFYHLYDSIKIGSLNRLLSSYISMLLYHTRRVHCSLLVTSMIRHRKAAEWTLAPSSRRILEAKSGVILNVVLERESGLAVTIVKHLPLKLQSKKLLIAREQIPIKV